MKIGILTITNGENYGNRLQNYATQTVLNSLGAEVETIKNFTGQPFINEDSLKEKIKRIVCKFYEKIKMNNNRKLNYALRCVKFREFNKKNIKISRYTISKDDIPQGIENYFDYFVCGSDQVWNPNFYFNSEVDFLTFAKKGQRIAYAPSFGVDDIQEDKRNEYIKWINGIDALSVREKAGADIVKRLTNKQAVVLVDPTMMLSKSNWLDIANKPKWKSDKKYILTYFLGNKEKESTERINKIAQKNNLEIIDLMNINDKNSYCVDPAEFVDLINNAELMCTDSFHGIVFSLIMKTPFILFNREDKEVSMNSRLETLLSLFNMESRMNKNVSDINIFNVDFSDVYKIIEIERNKAIEYLKNSLGIK